MAVSAWRMRTAIPPNAIDKWLRRNILLVMTMGSFQEVSDEIARKFDKLYLDHIEQGLHRGQFKGMAARGEITAADFAAELPEVVAGHKAGRDHASQRIMAQLVGMGSPDLTIATRVYRCVQESQEETLSLYMLGE